MVCGTAKCSPHNQVFINGVRHALMAGPAYQDGRFVGRPERGFRAMSRIYTGWALSQTFYREEKWRGQGASSLEDFLVANWGSNFARRDPADLLAQFWTWQHGDISANGTFNGDLPRALGAITAKVLLMPGDHDLYLQLDDNRAELEYLGDAELKPIPSVWGHQAGNPIGHLEDPAFTEGNVRGLLASR